MIVSLKEEKEGLFDVFYEERSTAEGIDAADDAIVALADGEMIDAAAVSGPMFTEKMMGESVKAGEPIVEVDLRKFSRKYEMPTMLIITNANDQTITFRAPRHVVRGESVIL